MFSLRYPESSLYPASFTVKKRKVLFTVLDTQKSLVMDLLKLHPEIQDYLNNTKHDLDAKLLTERRLRDIAAIQNSEDQLAAFRKLIL